MLEKEQIEIINKEICTKFPYLKDIQPIQEELPNGLARLSYSATPKTDSGFSLPITIKVKISSEGKIINISTTK